MSEPQISVVVPVYNEEGAAAPLAREIADALAAWSPEIIFVDDASADGTRISLEALRTELTGLRVLSHSLNAGQSRALLTGVRAARAPIVVTFDGDGQNVPADAPALVRRLADAPHSLKMVSGRRTGRKDTAARRIASRIANGLRKRLLDDGADDTGCGLKVFRRQAYLDLPYFDHMHRFLPALMKREGGEIAFIDVGHRPRRTGASKYNNLSRALVALPDILGVIWLRRRGRPAGAILEKGDLSPH